MNNNVKTSDKIRVRTLLSVLKSHLLWDTIMNRVSTNINSWGNPLGIVANMYVCDIAVSEFELQSRYNIHFWTYWAPEGVFMVVENYWYCWEILRFVSDSFSSYPYSLVIFFLLVETVKELRMEMTKNGILLNLIFIPQVYKYLMVGSEHSSRARKKLSTP